MFAATFDPFFDLIFISLAAAFAVDFLGYWARS